MATGNVYGHMKENNEALSDIPECPITKSGQEPISVVFPPGLLSPNSITYWVERRKQQRTLTHNLSCLHMGFIGCLLGESMHKTTRVFAV
jgi:hypothetical protein